MSDEIDLSQFHQAFFEEAQEHLVSMEELLLALDMEDPDSEELNAIFRAAHSIKGSAGTFGFLKVQDVTHVLESILDRIRNGTTEITNERTDLFLEAGDILKDLIDAHEAEEEIDEESANSIIERLQSDLDKETGASTSVEPEESDDESMSSGDFGMFEDDDDDLANGGSNPGDFGMFEEEEDLANGGSNPGDFGMFDILDEPNIDSASSVVAPQEKMPKAKSITTKAKKPKVKAKAPDKTIRVGVEKIDQLVNLIGEMVITQSVIALQSKLDDNEGENVKIDVAKLHEAIHTLQRNVRDLQETIMSIRMVPVNTVFNRFPRLVRDMSSKLGKDIDLVITGESTELDKGLIEKLSDPLTHILRNSIDHGIETREERAETDKKKEATVSIDASQVGGNIVIEVSDDGRGLNRDKILEKAKSNGLNVSDSMTNDEVWLIIFAPGFSTADKVSELSGRGVGMDVVKKNITSLGGRVEIQSTTGEGTTITIYLPLTMAILNGMIVKVEEINYIVPMLSIIETVKPNIESIKRVGGGSSRVMEIRGEHIPIVDVRSIFQLDSNAKTDTETLTNEYFADKIFMLIEAEDKKALIVLDELAGQQQVVIKNLEENYKKVTGISGATILGDGNIALILDINYFVALTNKDLINLDRMRENNIRISHAEHRGRNK